MIWIKLKLLSWFVGDTVPVAESIWNQLGYFQSAATDFKKKLDYAFVGDTHLQITPASFGLSPQMQTLFIEFIKMRGYEVEWYTFDEADRRVYSVKISDHFRRKAFLLRREDVSTPQGEE